LEVQTNPTNEMLKSLTDSIDWLREINDEITGKFQMISDIGLLTAQYAQSQVK
jgi:hypothetical protein